MALEENVFIIDKGEKDLRNTKLKEIEAIQKLSNQKPLVIFLDLSPVAYLLLARTLNKGMASFIF